MQSTRCRSIVALGLAVSVAGCGAGPLSPSGRSDLTPPPTAVTSYGEFADAWCSAFQALFRAVGNPDAGAGSPLSDALEAAASRGDAGAAHGLARDVTAELERGRERAAHAGTWPPAKAAAEQLDRLLVAYSRWAAALVEEAQRTPGAADPQTAFEQAGGMEAWPGVLLAMQGLGQHRPPGPPHKCSGVPISL